MIFSFLSEPSLTIDNPWHSLATPFQSKNQISAKKSDYYKLNLDFLLKTTLTCQVIILLYTMSQAH